MKYLKPLRFLVVEDNPGDQLLFRKTLEKTGIPVEQILIAASLSEVNALKEAHTADLAFVDLTLPDSYGIESFTRTKDLLPQVPVIVLSGFSDMKAAIEAISLGAQDYLMKDELDHKLLAKSIQYSIERHKSQLKLKESNDRYEVVNKATQDIIWDWNILTDELYLNNSLENILGYTNQYVTMQWFFDHIHPEDFEKVKQLSTLTLTRELKEWKEEFRFLAADGTYRYGYSRGYTLFNDEGLPYRMIGAATDITEKKKLEQELAEQRLNHQKEITETTIQAQEKERNELAKELHDNINQVLATVKMFLNIAKNNEGRRKEMLEKSHENVTYAIEEIRKLSKSLVAPSLGDIGLEEALKELTEEINNTNGLAIDLQCKAGCEKIMNANMQLMLYRIVQEQINNILKYARASSVRIELKCDNRMIFLTVEDNGVGFDPGQKAKGIGLKNISSRVDFYSGSMKIISAPGEGCRLEVVIPFSI